MRALALTALVLSASLASANPEATVLRQRCSEQERQITALETEIEALHSQLALERRRSRGAAVPVDVKNAPVAVPVTKAYKVQAGDTLSSIARRNGTTAPNLMKINGIKDPTRLLVGQTIQVTGTPPTLSPALPKKAPVVAKNKPTTYKVQKGDTFYKVAQNHSVTVAKLQGLNPGVNPSHIMVGQTLGVAGEPRKAIASAPKRRLPSNTKLISTKLPEKKAAPKPVAKKPVKKAAPKPAPKPTPKPAPKPQPKPTNFSRIIVMDQISFGKFADKHGTTPEQLNALNGLSLKSSTLLAKGSELYVSGR